MGSTGNADGSDGRIAIYYSTSFSGTANNAYLRNMSEELVDSIFLDGFESGDLSAWSSAQTDGGDLMASQSADYWGDYGLAASINDTNAIYVQDDTPDGEGTFHARFYINPDGINMGAADILPIFQGLDSGGSPVIKVEINNPSGSAFQVRVNVLEGSTWVPGSWQSLSGGWTAIEINYKTTHELGFSKLYINGNQTGSVSNINNPDHQLHSVRLGAVSIPSGTTSGVLYFDDYESRRYSTIGMLPERGVEDPEAVQEAGWAERVYSYQRSQPFAVQQVTMEEGTSTYDYDANGRGVKRSTPGGIERGNMTARVENGVSWTHTYNAENRLVSLANGVNTWLFSYDGDGTLVGQLVTDGVTATHTAFFMGGGYEVISDGVTETVRKYYALAGQTFGLSDDGVMKYLISDHLGSSVAITDNTGALLSETRYMPFGEPRADVGSITQTDKTYTGQRDVPDTGLMDYRARMYSPWLGRFIQPDTIVPGAGNSQAWNRYSYVLNSPLTFIDPTGHDVDCSPWDSACRQIVNAEMTNNGNLGLNPDGGNTNSPVKRGGRINSGRSGGSGFLPPSDIPSFGESYMTGWENFGTGIDILLNPDSSINAKTFARNYVLLWGGAHYVGLVGIVGLGIGVGEIVGGAGTACATNAQCAQTVSSNGSNISNNISDPIITVIGRWNANKILAEKIGGNYLNISMKVWDSLSTAQQWERNKQWLQEAVIRGDVFRLASNISEATPGSGFEKELNYLINVVGYTISSNSNYLYPPP